MAPWASPESILVLQEQHGYGVMLEAIMAGAKERLERLNRRRRETCAAAELVIGVQCGGSDAFSGGDRQSGSRAMRRICSCAPERQ
jgi:galactarate dehydratase (EC 4.2.1.42)